MCAGDVLIPAEAYIIRFVQEDTDVRDRLNDMQQLTLDALEAAAAPMTAYEVLDALKATRPTAAPPTAYRALTKLIALGLVHRLESLNAYVACSGGHGDADPAFSICDDCGHVDELSDPTIAATLTQMATAASGGFAPTKHVVELHGRCGKCRGVA